MDFKTLFGAAHATELIPLLGWYREFPFGWLVKDDASAAGLSEAMTSYWAEFAYNGDPGRGRDGALPEWSQYSKELPVMLLDSEGDGGVRMAAEPMSTAGIRDRLINDESLSQSEKCDAYVALFLESYQAPDSFEADVHSRLGGCQ